MATINMQLMRYINILDKASHVKTRKCFVYNNTVYFAVNKELISRAIGPSAINIRKMQEDIGKKIKIIREAEDVGDFQRFFDDIVSPVRVKSVETADGVVIVTAGSNQNKASLIGRNKRRFEELKKIVQDFFGLSLKVV